MCLHVCSPTRLMTMDQTGSVLTNADMPNEVTVNCAKEILTTVSTGRNAGRTESPHHPQYNRPIKI